MKDYRPIPAILSPFMGGSEALPFEIFYTLGRAYQSLGELARALDVFEQAVEHHGLNTLLLDALGECHFQLGRLPEARAAWERSLEIQPEQPAIRKLLDTLKEKR